MIKEKNGAKIQIRPMMMFKTLSLKKSKKILLNYQNSEKIFQKKFKKILYNNKYPL